MKVQVFIKKFVERKVEQNKIQKDEQELYEYAYLILALQTFNVLTVVLIGIFFRCLLPMLLFVANIIPLRSYAGGYHADSPESCSLLSAAMELFVALLISTGIYRGQTLSLVMLVIVAGIVIWWLAPIEAVNKPLSVEEVKRYRSKTHAILLTEIALLFVLLYLKYEVGVFVIAMCHICTAVSLLAVKLHKKSSIL